jgi:uncharacterized protein
MSNPQPRRIALSTILLAPSVEPAQNRPEVKSINLFASALSVLLVASCATRQPAETPDNSLSKKEQKKGNLMSAPIVYFEIAGPDGARLKEFYSTVFGWSIDAHSSIAAASTGGVKGGIRQDPPEKVLYLGVPDIMAALKQIEAAGGKTILPRTVVPGVVTFALFTDPAGNRMGLAELGSYPG